MRPIADKILAPNASTDELDHKVSLLEHPRVFTNGCFDILHRGHVTYLEQARQLGASLIVGLNSDESVRRQNKGSDRPITPLEDRMAILASLEAVDLVIPFNQDTPLELIKHVKPDYLVKGGDWPVDNIVGADIVTEYGGEVHSIAFEFERSTTALLNRIRLSAP